MKQLFLLLFIFTITANSQYDSSSPWMAELQKKSAKKEFTVKEISDAFNSYWEVHKEDKDKKGSGYKPFKRWENRWNLSLDKNGKIISNKEIWKNWEEKNQLSSRSINDISDWESVGPFTQESKSGNGRVNVIAVDPNNSNTYYVGAPAGGIWKSTDAGTTWNPLSDDLPQIGVSGIAIDPNNSDIIYIATGDDDAYDTYSVGVMKSTDAGLTWNTTGLQFNDAGKTSHEIYINPNDSNMLWVATSDGVYKTIDAGNNWNITLNGNIRDLKLKPNNPNIIYAVTSSNFPTISKFYKSTDAGASFTQITIGLPINSNRFAIDVTPANNDIVYLLSADNSNMFQGIYKSTNSGDSFTQTAETNDIFGGSDQSWYDMALTVSDTDENIVFVGVLDIWKSTNGGDNFVKINDWAYSNSPTFTHADIHFLRYYNNELFCGSDGGIYKSTNDGNSFNELNEGLAISQFYRIANAKQSSHNIAGGLQDNGGFAFSNNTWYNYHVGDGMDCAIDPNNQDTYYGFTQYGGYLSKTENGGVTTQGVTGAPEQGNWITPLVMNNDGELYAGYSKLYKLSFNQWEEVSGDVFGGNLDYIEIDPNNTNIIFVSRYNNLYKSTNKGDTFNLIYSTQNNISSIEINNDDSSIIYLTTSSGEDGQILKSIDYGASFINITDNLPSESKLIIKHLPYSPSNDLYVGTSLGVYHINDDMPSWESFSTNLPNVPIRDLEINLNDEKLIAGTYGRSVWQTTIEVVPPANDVRLIKIENPRLDVSCSNSIIPIITIKNNGQNTINQVNINYSIDNTDLSYMYNSSIGSLQTIDVTLPEITNLSLGEHSFSVTVMIDNDAISENNSSNSKFYINNADDNPTTVNPFDNNSNEWMVASNSLSQIWEIGTPSTTLLGAVGNTGYVTTLSSNYPDNSSGYLISPCYDLTTITNPIVKFDMAFDIEADWDVLYVEYSTNQGESWEVLGTADDPNWYNSNYDAHQLTIGKQWSGTDATLKEYSHDLNFLTNESSVLFRFAFLTDTSGSKEGVIIDNFVIEGQVAGVDDNNVLNGISIYPNPSNGVFTITKANSNNLDILVFDITGKTILSKTNITENNYSLNLKTVDKGIYFIKLLSNNKQLVKKIIVN